MKRWSIPGSGGDGGRVAVVAYLLCAVYLHVVVSLLSWTVLPALAGLDPTLIVSGSMAPRINAGDVVLLGDAPDDLRRGNVITFADTNRSGRLLTHRVVRQNTDGTYTTRGDANGSDDSRAVDPELVRGIGRAVVPAVGAPAMWVRDGRWDMLLGWGALSALAFAYLHLYGRARPALWGWSAALNALPVKPSRRWSPTAPAVRGGWEPPWHPVRRARWVMLTLLLAVGLVAAAMPAAMSSEGAFTAGTQNSDNVFLAASAFCANPGTQTLTPTADAKIDQFTPTTNYGGTADLVIEPRNNRAKRSLILFNLPAVPTGCTTTATLRVYDAIPVAGRLLEAWAAGGAWTEGAVTWNLAPGPTGTAATATSPATAGWIDFVVTDQVAAMYAGTNNGFILKEPIETIGNNLAQTLSSRTGANPPQLVITFAS